MKVQLRGTAVFYFPVTLKLVRQLMKLSKQHYDGACNRASARCGQPLYPGSVHNQMTNGILTIWFDRFDIKDEMSEVEVRGTWDEMDLVAKVCEGAHMQAGYDEVRIFRYQVMGMLMKAGPIVLKTWPTEIVV